MKTSFENSNAIKFKVDVEVSSAIVDELAKRLKLSLFAGVGGFRNSPCYSDHLAGWPSIEQLSDTDVDACVDSLRKNILFRISEFAGTGKAKDLKKAEALFDFYRKLDNYTSTNPQISKRRGKCTKDKRRCHTEKVNMLYYLLIFSLLLSFLFPLIHNGKIDIHIIEDVFTQLMYTFPQNLVVATSIELTRQNC